MRKHRAKQLLHRKRLTRFATGLLALAAIVTGVFLAFKAPDASATDVTVNNFALLQTAISTAPNDGTPYDIGITGDITVTGQLTIGDNQNITIHSEGARHTLLRDPAYTGALLASSATATASSALTITNLILDGNKASVDANAALIEIADGSRATLNIGAGAVLRNNKNIDHGGGGLRSFSSTNIYGDAIIENNESDNPLDNGGGGVRFVTNELGATAAFTVNIYGDVQIRDNQASSYGGGMMAKAGSGIITVNIYGNAAFLNNQAANGGGINLQGSVAVDIRDDVLIQGNQADIRGGLGIYDAVGQVQQVDISGNVTIDNNKATSYAGGLSLSNMSLARVSVSGNVKVTNNEAATYAGGAFFNNLGGQSSVSDSVEIANNKAGTYSGGLYLSSLSNMTVTGNVKITNNEAGTYGGGVYNGSPVTFSGNVEISGNKALGRSGSTAKGAGGGGIFIGNSADNVTITDNVKIKNNIATVAHGGGIAINQGLANPLIISGNVEISDNDTAQNGGGIYITPTGANMTPSDYAKLSVDTNVRFANNSAQSAYQIDPADIPLHNAQILTHNFTAPFSYGYNNYDINYTGGQQVYTVLFDSNGGSAVQGQTVLATGTEVASRPTDPTRAGYKFLGWFADQALTQEYDFSSVVTGNVVVYAKWEKLPGAPNTGSPKADPDTALPVLAVIVAVALIGGGLVGRRILAERG